LKRELLQDRETFHYEVSADENNLSGVRDFIADVCMRAGFSRRDTNNTKLAMDEACTNIIKHAYREKGGDIRIDVQAEPGKVEINIFDRGIPFEWSKIKDPDLHQYVEIGKKGGLGIFLMNRLMDDLDYHSSDAGNRLFMSKSIAAGVRRPRLFGARTKLTSTLRFKFGLRAALGLFALVFTLWIFQFVNQTRDVKFQMDAEWVGMRDFARTIAAKSENALVLDDLYDPEYRKMTDFISERVDNLPAVAYAQLVNSDGVIVSSNNIEQFQDIYEIPDGFETIPSSGRWREVTDPQYGTIMELHYPIRMSAGDESPVVGIGRVVVGVSEAVLTGGIHDPRTRTTLIFIGIFIIGISLIYFLVTVFVRPIQALTDGVRAIGEGSLQDRIEIDGPEEIGEIARAFNDITQKFQKAQESVVEQERFHKEMQVAQEIQHSLLPKKVPEISGYDISSLYRAAKEVGGDYYDFVKVNEDTMGVVVGDVSGKGVPGSLVMTMIRTALRMEARGNLSAADVMSRMNEFVTGDMKKGMFVTVFYVILDSKNRIISYASAGHNPMILYRAEKDETFNLNPRGFPVGISLPDDSLFRRSIDVEKIKLKKDDMLIIYTDGVTEAMNESREQYGEERLIKIIKECGGIQPKEFIERLREDIDGFTGNNPQNDDITVVAIKEKLMADDVLYGIRKRLLDLVDLEGMTVADACQKMNVSPSTYYRYKKRMAEMGDRGLKNKALRKEHEIRRISLEQRKDILEIVNEHPEFGAKRIVNVFNEGRARADHVSASIVYDELKRMRLNTYEKRLEYLRRNRVITEEEFQQRLAEPSTGHRAAPAEPVEAEGAKVIPIEAGRTYRQSGGEEIEGRGDIAADSAGEEEGLVFEMETGHVEIESRDADAGIIVLRINGHLDSSSASELEAILENIYSDGYLKIIIDLAEVPYISSGGWGIFTSRVKLLREGEGDVVLVGMSPEVFDIYELLGFQNILMHFQKTDEALDFLSIPFNKRQKMIEEMAQLRKREPTLEQVSESSGTLDLALEQDQDESPWTPLKIEAGTVGEMGEITVLYLAGVIDTVSSMKLHSVMDDLLGRGNIRMVIDMSRVEYVSSSGWGVFSSRIADVRGKDGDIKIFGMSSEVNGIFHLLGFDSIMRSFSILAEAIADFNRPVKQTDTEASADEEIVEKQTVYTGRRNPSEVSESFNLDASISESSSRNAVVLALSGAIDASTTKRLEECLIECTVEGKSLLIVDMSDVVYISSSGWGVLIKYVQQLREDSRTIALAGMSSPIFKIFRDLGFEPLIPNYISVKRAIADLDRAGSIPGRDGVSGKDAAVADRAHDPVQVVDDSEAGGAPEIDSTGIEPMDYIPPEKGDGVGVIELDFDKSSSDHKENKDSRIRGLGWAEYGKRLLRRNRDTKSRKK